MLSNHSLKIWRMKLNLIEIGKKQKQEKDQQSHNNKFDHITCVPSC